MTARSARFFGEMAVYLPLGKKGLKGSLPFEEKLVNKEASGLLDLCTCMRARKFDVECGL